MLVSLALFSYDSSGIMGSDWIPFPPLSSPKTDMGEKWRYRAITLCNASASPAQQKCTWMSAERQKSFLDKVPGGTSKRARLSGTSAFSSVHESKEFASHHTVFSWSDTWQQAEPQGRVDHNVGRSVNTLRRMPNAGLLATHSGQHCV